MAKNQGQQNYNRANTPVVNATTNTVDTTRSANAEWMNVNDFKNFISADKLDIVRNPHTGKFFMTANGENFKVQQNIFVEDASAQGGFRMQLPQGKELKVMFPNGVKHEEAMQDVVLQAATISNNLVVTL